MDTNQYCVIMAGGVGSRFWPLSRQSKPKQFLDILGTGKSFLRGTFERFLPMVPIHNFLIVTNLQYKNLVLEQLPELSENQILCEPIGRSTAPCVAYATYSIAATDPSAKVIVTPADHFITGDNYFRDAVQESLDFIEYNDALVTIGIKPTRPETAYGYIQVSDIKSSVSRAKCFIEKPNVELAATFVENGEFVWNSGLFVGSVKSIIGAYQKCLPECHSLFSSILTLSDVDDSTKFINDIYSDLKSISVDFAIMERAENVFVKIGKFDWSDIGTWSSLLGHTDTDKDGNIAHGQSYLYNTENTIISTSSEKIVVASGLKDYIVVDTDDVLMICPRSDEHSIKNFTEDIKYRCGNKLL